MPTACRTSATAHCGISTNRPKFQPPRIFCPDLYDLLFKASAETTLKIAATPKHLGVRIGFMAAHVGSALTHHPHVHMVVPGGGLSPDGSRWIACRPRYFFTVEVLSALFRRLFLEMLVAAHDAGQLQFFGDHVGLADKAAFDAYPLIQCGEIDVLRANVRLDPRRRPGSWNQLFALPQSFQLGNVMVIERGRYQANRVGREIDECREVCMSDRGIRSGTVVFASILAFAVTTDVQGRGFGGGGRGGGGMHFGGGGMHFGGGGMHFGGMRFGGLGRIGGIRFGGRSFHLGGRSFAHRGVGARYFAGRVNPGRSFAARHGVHAAGAAAALGAGHVAGRAVAHNNFGHDHFPHGHFANNFHNFPGSYGYGWYGPLFWPYAYDDIFDDLFWAFGYGDPFWDYGYGDIYGGLFSPYGYDDLAGYLPGGAHGQAGPSLGPSSSRVSRSTESRQATLSSQLGQMCGDDTKEVAGWPIDRIEQSVSPTSEQRAALDGFANATIRAAQTIKNACPTNVAFAPTGRLDAMQKRLEGMAQAVDIVRPPLDRFYTSLTDEQKARLNAANEKESQNGGSLAGCSAVTNADQQTKLDALKTAMADAADDLAKACPSTLPTTPPARLVAISMRLNTMLQAVKNVRAALDDFYTSLSDEQKSQFNMIGRQHTAQR